MSMSLTMVILLGGECIYNFFFLSFLAVHFLPRFRFHCTGKDAVKSFCICNFFVPPNITLEWVRKRQSRACRIISNLVCYKLHSRLTNKIDSSREPQPVPFGASGCELILNERCVVIMGE